MGEIRETQLPVKLFFALMAPSQELFDECQAILANEYGPLDLHDETYEFDPLTAYYADEFGTGLLKHIVSAERLIAPEALVAVKRRTNDIETTIAKDHGAQNRVVNIDPGYLNHSKVVLATTKDQAHRLYMGQGIFEEITLSFRKKENGFQTNPWTYRDYQMPGRIDFFNRLRQIYCQQLTRGASA